MNRHSTQKNKSDKTFHWCAQNVEDLPAIARQIIPLIQYNTILFYGDMGTGKTTFIKELLAQLGSDDIVSSPTYALVNEYHTPNGVVYHFDFYRIQHPSEAFDMGWEEYAYSTNLCLVEWPERIKSLFPENYHTFHIQNQNNVRTITFN